MLSQGAWALGITVRDLLRMTLRVRLVAPR